MLRKKQNPSTEIINASLLFLSPLCFSGFWHARGDPDGRVDGPLPQRVRLVVGAGHPVQLAPAAHDARHDLPIRKRYDSYRLESTVTRLVP